MPFADEEGVSSLASEPTGATEDKEIGLLRSNRIAEGSFLQFG